MPGGERRLRILGLLADHSDEGFSIRRGCELGAEVSGMTGAGLMLMSGDIQAGSLCSTDAVSALIEDLQYALGEGPCVDACRSHRPVLEPNLVEPATPRWLAFSGPAVDAGVSAVFGFPLQVGSVRLGALDLYRDSPGTLTDDQHADALVLADVAAQAVLLLQAGAPPGLLAAELEAGADFHYVVQQASGIVAAQLGISVEQAHIRLRGYAFSNGRTLHDVSAQVVARTLSLALTPAEPEASE